VKYKSDYSVQNDESLRDHCTNERRVRKRDKKMRSDVIEDDSRRWREGGTAVTCDGRLFHRRTAATGNALSPTVDRRVRRMVVVFGTAYMFFSFFIRWPARWASAFSGSLPRVILILSLFSFNC